MQLGSTKTEKEGKVHTIEWGKVIKMRQNDNKKADKFPWAKVICPCQVSRSFKSSFMAFSQFPL